MKLIRRMIIIILAGWPALLPAEESAAGTGLRQCYEWGLRRSEDLKARREDILQSESRARAASGGILPLLKWEVNDTWQDPSGVDELERKGFSGFVNKNQVESFVSLKQPVFSGFKEFSAGSGFKRQQAMNALKFERASKELYQKTAEAFYAVQANET